MDLTMGNQKVNITFRPVSKKERIRLLDIVRGFALLGVLLMNIYGFSGYGLIDADQAKGALFFSWDEYVEMVLRILMETKFVTIFSILFGVGFYIQFERARQRGIDFKIYFARRMFIMLIIGCIHAYLLWCGDIIRYYAVFGFTLIFVSGWSTKTILRVGIAFTVFIAATIYIVQPFLDFQYVPGNPYRINRPELLFNAFANGTYLEVVEMNWQIDPIHNFLKVSTIRVAFIFGRILIGFWMGRIALFSHPEKHHKRINNWFWYGLIIGTMGSVAFWMVSNDIIVLESPWLVWVPFAVIAGLLLHSLFYVSAIFKLYSFHRFRRFLSIFEPIGKMAFSNYIFQTLICLFIFYGCFQGPNLMGKVGPTILLLIGLMIFALQIILSRWWLKHHEFGPIEKLWRQLSYFRIKTIQ